MSTEYTYVYAFIIISIINFTISRYLRLITVETMAFINLICLMCCMRIILFLDTRSLSNYGCLACQRLIFIVILLFLSLSSLPFWRMWFTRYDDKSKDESHGDVYDITPDIVTNSAFYYNILGTILNTYSGDMT